MRRRNQNLKYVICHLHHMKFVHLCRSILSDVGTHEGIIQNVFRTVCDWVCVSKTNCNRKHVADSMEFHLIKEHQSVLFLSTSFIIQLNRLVAITYCLLSSHSADERCAPVPTTFKINEVNWLHEEMNFLSA